MILDRSEAYIGVLIDDLTTKENTEPYRMMTSRAEYRLLLRQDNADLRLTPVGRRVGLIDDARWAAFTAKRDAIEREIERVKGVTLGTSAPVQALLAEYGSTPLKSGITMEELIRRPELDYEKLQPVDPERPELPADVREQVNIEIKYEGYIRRQRQQVEHFKKLESRLIPDDIDYSDVGSLRIEAAQKLERFRPHSLGQASRIAGVSPADVAMLNVWLEQGFGEEAIAIAADRTVTNTGSLKWSYLSKILQSWHQKGLHSPAEIAEKDPARRGSAPTAQESRVQKPLTSEQWDQLLDKI